jgi:hypothetical protein
MRKGQQKPPLPMQLSALREYARKRKWTVTVEVMDVGSGATTRPKHEFLIAAARRRETLVLVWRFDRWGTVAGRSREHVAGTECARSGICVTVRGARPDHAERPRVSRHAGRVRRIRAGYIERPGEGQGNRI